MSLRISRVTLTDVLCFESLSVDLGGRVVLTGANSAGKTSFLRALGCILGLTGESLASLVRTDANGRPVKGAVPEGVVTLDGDGETYRVTRRGKTLKVECAEGDSWRDIPPTPDQALAGLFDRDSSPAAFLSEKLTDQKRIELLLEVAEAEGYERTRAIVDAGLIGFKFDPITTGLHPLEDLERLRAQVFEARTGVERERRDADGAAKALEASIAAAPPEDVAEQLAKLGAEVEAMSLALVKDEGEITALLNAERAEAGSSRSDTVSKAEAVMLEKIRQAEAEFAQAKQVALEEFQSRCVKAEGSSQHAAASLQERRSDLLDARESLAKLRVRQEMSVADRAVRERAAEARAKERRLAERHAELTVALESLKAQAAAFASKALPGIRIETDEKGRRELWLETDGGWQPWDRANGEARMRAAGLWATMHQAKRSNGGRPQLALILMDEGEMLDSAHLRSTLDRLAEHGQVILAVRGEGELRFEEA